MILGKVVVKSKVEERLPLEEEAFLVTESVGFWLPYISIQEIDVEMTDEMKDRNQANMKLIFTVGNDIDTQEITFTIQG